jgi:hypothetical protein
MATVNSVSYLGKIVRLQMLRTLGFNFVAHFCMACLITYFLTAWIRVLLVKVTSSQLLKKFAALYGT